MRSQGRGSRLAPGPNSRWLGWDVLSTILDADRIAIVAEGGISELGSHEELVAAGGRYAALYAGWPRATHHL
jgi:hypothetical protein